jgi:hypothetical protein
MSECKPMLISGIIVFLTAAIIMAIGFFLLYFLYMRQIKCISNTISQTTLRLFNMLSKALIIHIVFISTFLTLPLITFVLIYDTGNNYGSLPSQIMLFPVQFHSFSECFCLLIIVKPYKEFLICLYNKCYNKLKGVNNSIGCETLQVVYVNPHNRQLAKRTSDLSIKFNFNK